MHPSVISGVILCALYISRNESDDGFTAEWVCERLLGLSDRISCGLSSTRQVLHGLVAGEMVRPKGQYPDITYSITTLGVAEAERHLKVMEKLLAAHRELGKPTS